MNIKVQVCALVLLLLTFFFYKRQRSTGLKTASTFYHLMLASMASLSLDIGSIICIHYQDLLFPVLVHIVCKLYLLSIVAVAYLILTYTTLDIHSEKNRKTFNRIYSIFTLLTCLGISFLPIQINMAEESYFTAGPSVLVTYAGAGTFFLMILVHLFLYKKRLADNKFFSMLITAVVLFTAGILQGLANDLLIIGYAIALSVTILFVRLENPLTNIDKCSGAFTSHVLRDYIKQCYSLGEDFAILVLNFEQDRKDSDAEEDVELALTPIVSFLHLFADIKVFCHEEKELYLVFKNENTLLNNLPQIKQRFKNPWTIGDLSNTKNVILKPVYITFTDKSFANSADEVLKLFNFVTAKINPKTEFEEFAIDAAMIAERKRFEDMEATILKAIEEDRIEVFYQPIYSTHKKVFTSAEALVRIRQEDGAILPPGAFIPVAEETGLISKIGEIVFDKTCRFLSTKDMAQYGLEYIEVNLSVYQCEEEDLADRYIGIMDKYKLSPSKINLEITETGSMHMRDILLSNMQKLISYGVTFSLDDFGSGQSNLNYIVDMPVHIVKFDRDMTQSYFDPKNDKGKFVMRAATMMIHDLSLKVVSEGVETADQLEKMEEQGIDYIQGYYFSKPLPQTVFYEFIKEHAKAC